MTDMTAAIQRPNVNNDVTPTYTQCTAADKFAAGVNCGYMLHFKNGATPTGTIFLNEKVAATPAGTTPAIPAGATKWSDKLISASLIASTERIVYIDNITPYIDASGFVNIQTTTPTTLSVCILGPL